MILSRIACAAICASALVQSAAAAPSQKLLHHVPQAVYESRQMGPVAEATNLNLAIGLPLRNQGELDLLVEQIADPRSGNYRQYLSTSEFAERFGPTEQDYDKLIAFAEANGFTVAGKHANRMILDVSGPVWAINKACTST